MMVSSQAIESTSDEIVKLREEELYPQLVKGKIDLRELASAESPYTFALVYTHILNHQPDYPLER
ncbi:hypothetical protein Hdeb2414_s0010g00334721 [Helianthus debilis subsp. tardiflorus]